MELEAQELELTDMVAGRERETVRMYMFGKEKLVSY